jgi:hypothetical protein
MLRRKITGNGREGERILPRPNWGGDLTTDCTDFTDFTDGEASSRKDAKLAK